MTVKTHRTPAGHILNGSIWLAQLMLAGPFVFGGIVKLTTPIPELANAMSWVVDHPTLARVTGVIDIAGGIGVLLPALLRIRPGLTVAAAVGCALLQVCAMTFHITRSETFVLPMNVVFLALAVFIAWGRGRLAPIAPRASGTQ